MPKVLDNSLTTDGKGVAWSYIVKIYDATRQNLAGVRG